MNSNRFVSRIIGCVSVLICFASPLRADEQPVIKSVRIENGALTVTAQIPAGLTKATLQSRTRAAGSSWIPRGVTRLDSPGRDVTFRIPLAEQIEFVRVRADSADPLPSAYYNGTNRFGGEISSTPVDGVPPTRSPGDILTGGPTDNAEKSRTVVESDIWKVSGSRLYFYNQFRGLQILDIANPGVPAHLGTYPLPASGEQMYLLDSHAVLLARNNCSLDGVGTSQVVILNVVDGQKPTLVVSLPIDGYISESRMVGTALYVASQTYRTRIEKETTIWEWGTLVSSFDLATPSAPVAKSAQWVAGYGNVVTATDKYLFVSTINAQDYWRSDIYCFDISTPSGEIAPVSVVTPAGRIDDKFKINMADNILTTISIRWENGRGWITWLENFSFTNAATPTKVGGLQLGEGEQLHATRFDGTKAYIVTFFRVDPLWIVDLSDPSKPRIAGELQVPGWSTYIYPWGDRLVSIGIDPTAGWRVAVSLFDVHDPAKPAIIDKELLGQNYSWSEATYDEKAFNILPEHGLILLPYSGNVSSNGWAQQVQLIDLATNSLTLRGAIEHQFQPRRATIAGEHILSISSRELLSVDATDRDHPVVKTDLELSWSVDRIFLARDHILEMEKGGTWWWYNSDTPTTIRVASKAEPDRIINAFSLPSRLQVTGAGLRDGLLYLVQSRSFYEYPTVVGANGQSEAKTNLPAVILTILDVRNLPELTELGSAIYETTNPFWGNFDPIWVKTNVVVWAGGSGGYWWLWRDPMMDGPVKSSGAPGAQTIVSRPYFWGGSGNGRFFTFDVGDSSNPKFLNDIALNPTNHWNFSAALQEGSLIFVSDQSWEYALTNETSGYWISRSFLNVIDFSDPLLPALRKPVNIPGALKGLSHSGKVIYTSGPHWSENNQTDWSEWIDASAYDDVDVHLIDSLYAGPAWTTPSLVNAGAVYTTKVAAAGASNSLKLSKLSSAGKFSEQAATDLSYAPSTLALVNDVLVVRDSYAAAAFFNAAPDTTLQKLTQISEPNCLWFQTEFAQGSQADGLWIPLSDYGLWNISLQPR